MAIIIFDFDSTLTKKDTLRPFGVFIAKKENKKVRLWLFYFYLLLYKFKLISDKKLKERFLKLFFKRKNTQEAGESAKQFFEDKLDALLNESVFKKLLQHQQAGDEIYLASANFDFFLEPLKEKWGLHGLICTETEKEHLTIDNKHLTGRISGETCKGKNKVQKLINHLGENQLKNALAYGDKEDNHLFKAVTQSFNVNNLNNITVQQYNSITIKRTFDLIFSLFCLLIFSWLMIIIAILIKLTSKGPVIYKGARVGLHGKIFKIWKFRTMVQDAEQKGGSNTSNKDPRITKVGALLRKFKLDELPQFFNVLKGDMCIVGPRPEVAYYVNLFNDEEKAILSVRPGITDWATLWDHDEGAVLAKYEDPDKAYMEIIRPMKLKLQLKYVREQSFRTDLRIIFLTFYTLMTRKTSKNRKTMERQ